MRQSLNTLSARRAKLEILRDEQTEEHRIRKLDRLLFFMRLTERLFRK